MIIQALPYPSSVPLILGNNGPAVANLSLPANFQSGLAVQATASGILTKAWMRGSSAAAYTTDYRMCIYDVPNPAAPNTWGNLLGQTAIQHSLGINELRSMALLASVTIVNGNWYVVTCQPDSPGMASGATVGTVRAIADAFADGPAATLGATFLDSGTNNNCIWASD